MSTALNQSTISNSFINKQSNLHKIAIRNKIFRFIVIAEDQAVIVNLFKNSVKKLSDLEDIFKDNTIDAYGHELNILYYNDLPLSYIYNNKMYGVNGYMKDIICGKLNATCILHVSDLEVPRDLRTFYSEGYDIQLNLHSFYRSPNSGHQQEATMIYPMQVKSVCVLVVKDVVDIMSTDGLMVMSPPLTFLMLTLCFIGVLWYFLLRKTDNRITVIDVIFNMFRILLLIPICRRFNLKFEKLMVCILFLTNIIIFESYKMAYVAQWIQPQYKNEINSLSKLNESNITIYATESTFNWLNGTHFEDTIFMKRFIRSNYFPYKYLLSGKKSKNIGFLVYEYSAKNFMAQNAKRYDLSSFHLIDECISYSPSSYPIAHSFLFKEEVNRYLMFIREAGLVNYWLSMNKYYLRKHNLVPKQTKMVQTDSNCVKSDSFNCKPVFSFDSLFTIFKITGFGYVLSILVFFGEILVSLMQKYRRVIFLGYR